MKPTLPQGTRDFGPEIVRKRNFIFSTIKSVFELYGFQPLETPAMENLETLMGKYGDEGDKLIFKILNNGLDNPAKKEQVRDDFEEVLRGKNTKGITERALRYDLTIPFARFVAMNHGQLTFPFKRYQLQPVWRADRPQKGRYREFYQCDADVVGSRSLYNEVDLVNIYHQAFSRLGLKDYDLRVNSRKILAALSEKCGGPENMMSITMAIDKLDKIGPEKVKEELHTRGIGSQEVALIEEYLRIDGTNQEKLEKVSTLLNGASSLDQGIEELNFVVRAFDHHDTNTGVNLAIDFTLARGLNYYTGIIFEAKAPAEVKMGSIGGGGRYDDLTGLFGLPGIPGVGISFGVDRIYDVMEELDLFPPSLSTVTKYLFFNLGEQESAAAYKLMTELRNLEVGCELYHEPAKFDRQFKYAEKKSIPFAVILGSKELENRTVLVKNLETGIQDHKSWEDFLSS